MRRSRFLSLSTLYLVAHAALAEQAMPSAEKNANATVQTISAIRGEVIAADRLTTEFESLAGSHQNAQNLILGLRNAKAVRMVTPMQAEAEASFTPPTAPMSFADIHQALSLAQAQLLTKHIDSPSPGQLKASLAGGELPNAEGDLTHVTGILPLHRRGMSWDAIARALHVAAPRRMTTVKDSTAEM